LSGIVGIYHGDNAPVDRGLLESLADFLSFRGPDARGVWTEGAVGFAHTMLRTTQESLEERQPARLEGRLWITADARLDGRAEFLTELRRAGREVGASAPDSEVILHAYAVWGSECVDHLLGDFSFAIWDARSKTLFCARDHFGIKPFYYLQEKERFLFSNTLNCLRLHPEVSAELNDAAIGDFLLFGLNYDNATTTYRAIQRLPPAHSLSFSASGLRLRRYWAPPTAGPIRYSNSKDYIDHFQALLQEAVADRLRTERVGILLSGGLDSSSVAAVARDLSSKSTHSIDIRGFTSVYDSLIPDREREYAQEVGEFLRIPMKFTKLDEVQLFDGWNDPEMSYPEPIDSPLLAGFFESCRSISPDCRVVLSGEGADNLMSFEMWPYAESMRRNGEWRRLASEMANYLWVRPFPWRGIRARFRKLIGKDEEMTGFPRWLQADFVKRMNLEHRWKELSEHPVPPSRHPILPKAHASLSLPHWTHMFETEDAGVTNFPVETRYPFLDLRIVNYLLALPPFPWFFQKMLLREAMGRQIPERVRVRPKTPLQGDPLSAQVKRSGTDRLKQIPWSKNLNRYIERSALEAPHDKMNPRQVSASLRPYCLNIWLQSARRVRYKMHAEAGNG
jgi:asparagine synthase (glutamine-hydrolysing)